MVIQEKLLNDYIVRANLHKITQDQAKIATALDALDDALADVRVDVADLINQAGPGPYRNAVVDAVHQLRAAVTDFSKARGAYRRALQEYIAEQ